MHFTDSNGFVVEVGTIVSFAEISEQEPLLGGNSYVVAEFLPNSYEVEISQISDPFDAMSVIPDIDPIIVNSWEICAI